MTPVRHTARTAGAGPAGPPARRRSGVSTDLWPADAVDIDIPHQARVFDALLGGGHNFVADRDLAAQLRAAALGLAPDVYAERHFLRRALEFCVDVGIRQFLDLGSGIPSVGNACDI